MYYNNYMLVINLEKFRECDLSFYLGLEKHAINNIKDDCFFIWDINKSIIIGKNQLLEAEVNVEKALNAGYKIYRRPSGGGAICADENCFMFTFISSYQSKDEMYATYLNKMINTLHKLGLDVYLSGRNDLMFNNKKFSGNAIYYENNRCILHGTFLYDSNLDLLVDILNPSNDKLKSKGIKSVKERVINIKPYISLSKNELITYLNNNIDESIKMYFLNDEEISIVNKYKCEFEDYDYVYKKNIPFTYTNTKRFSCGEISIFIDVNGGIIKDINLLGDFFQTKDLKELYDKYINHKYEDIELINKDIDIQDYILGLNKEEYNQLFN